MDQCKLEQLETPVKYKAVINNQQLCSVEHAQPLVEAEKGLDLARLQDNVKVISFINSNRFQRQKSRRKQSLQSQEKARSNKKQLLEQILRKLESTEKKQLAHSESQQLNQRIDTCQKNIQQLRETNTITKNVISHIKSTFQDHPLVIQEEEEDYQERGGRGRRGRRAVRLFGEYVRPSSAIPNIKPTMHSKICNWHKCMLVHPSCQCQCQCWDSYIYPKYLKARTNSKITIKNKLIQ